MRRFAARGMNPHFLFGCAEKKTAVHGQKKRRWRPEFSPAGKIRPKTGVSAIGAVGFGSLYRMRRWSWGTGVVLSRMRGRRWGFRGGRRMGRLLFSLPLPWHFRDLGRAAAAGRRKSNQVCTLRHPRAVRRGLTAGSLSKTGPAPNASTTPTCQGILLKPPCFGQIFPQRGKILAASAFSFGPCTARFLFGAVEKEMGGASPRTGSGAPLTPAWRNNSSGTRRG